MRLQSLEPIALARRENFVLGRLNGLHQDLLEVVPIAPPARDRGLVAVVLLVVEANRDCIWNVELLYGSGSNQHSVLAAATKDCQSKKKRAEFQHIRRDHR